MRDLSPRDLLLARLARTLYEVKTSRAWGPRDERGGYPPMKDPTDGADLYKFSPQLKRRIESLQMQVWDYLIEGKPLKGADW